MNVASFAVRARRFAPGLLLSFAVALSATLLEPLFAQGIFATTGAAYKLPAMVIALLIGIALHPIALNKRFETGITYAVKILLRIAIALLGLRIALSDIAALGLWTPLLIVLSMAITLVAAMALARVLGQNPGVGALMGAANAICGASATLATSTVLPNYKNKDVDVAFTVIAANAVSTIVMVLYPPLCILLGYTPQQTGIMLGATIHDMAQVVGAGYAVSEPVGNSAVIVKLFRVFMLLPVVLMIGWYFVGRGGESHVTKVPVPIFAVVFLGLCIANSIIPSLPGAAAIYEPIRNVLILLSTWGLLIAIGALGLGTSVTALGSIGWRHVVIFTGATIVILAIVLAGLPLL